MAIFVIGFVLLSSIWIPADKLVIFDYYSNNGSFGDTATNFDSTAMDSSLAEPMGVVSQKNISWISPTEVEVTYDIEY